MSTCQPPTRDIEEDWIVKYRAALNAAPIEQSLATRLRAALTYAWSLALAHTVTVVNKWSHWQSFLTNPTLQPKLTANERLRIPFRKSDCSPAQEGNRYKKAS